MKLYNVWIRLESVTDECDSGEELISQFRLVMHGKKSVAERVYGRVLSLILENQIDD